MAKNADNVRIWKDADVYFSDKPDAKVGADGEFGPDWAQVGLLNGGSEIGQEFDGETTEVGSFGGRIVLTDRAFRKDTRTFSALEDNETTFALMWPGSEFVETGATVLRVPKDAEGVIAFRTVDQKGRVVIDISRELAKVRATGAPKSDEGATATEFTVDVLPDNTDSLYDRLVISADDAVGAVPTVIRVEAPAGP